MLKKLRKSEYFSNSQLKHLLLMDNTKMESMLKSMKKSKMMESKTLNGTWKIKNSKA